MDEHLVMQVKFQKVNFLMSSFKNSYLKVFSIQKRLKIALSNLIMIQVKIRIKQ
jgi:hypothetical protein